MVESQEIGIQICTILVTEGYLKRLIALHNSRANEGCIKVYNLSWTFKLVRYDRWDEVWVDDYIGLAAVRFDRQNE